MTREEFRWKLWPEEQAAAQRFIEELRRRFPEVAEGAEYGRGYEGTVYVYSHLPEDEDADIEIHETMSHVTADVLDKTGVSVLLMRDNLMRVEETVQS
jgi:plasmid stabilization system protein ParE